MQRTTLLLTAAAGTALLAATVLQARSAGPATSPASAPLGSRPASVAAEGRVVAYPDAEVKVSAERAGRLTAVRVREGDRVRKGDVLAVLDSVELRAALAEAEARVSEAEAELRLAESTLARRQQLVDERIVAVHDLDQARRDLDIARARRETARAEVDRYQAQIDKTVVRAPIAGTVVTRHVETGETVEAGAAVATLADLSRLRIEGEADEADAAALAVEGAVRITAEGYPGRSWRGRIEEVGQSVSGRKLKPQDPSRPTDTRILAVKVAFAEPTPLKLGTTVELQIAR